MPSEEGGISRAIGAAGFVLVPIDTTQPAAVSLRDWFAGVWISGAASHHNMPEISDEEKARKVALQAYRIADAMMTVRVAAAETILRGKKKASPSEAGRFTPTV